MLVLHNVNLFAAVILSVTGGWGRQSFMVRGALILSQPYIRPPWLGPAVASAVQMQPIPNQSPVCVFRRHFWSHPSQPGHKDQYLQLEMNEKKSLLFSKCNGYYSGQYAASDMHYIKAEWRFLPVMQPQRHWGKTWPQCNTPFGCCTAQ